MTTATALVSANDASHLLAENAVREALQRAGRSHANGVVLFLSPEFTHHAQAAVVAAARAAQSLQVFGGIVAGCCTDSGWVLDRPCAAAMVLCDDVSLASGSAYAGENALICCTTTPFPSEWRGSRRVGIHFHGSAGHSAVWQNGRVLDGGCAETGIVGTVSDLAVSHGLKPIGEILTVERTRGYDLLHTGGRSALDTLLRALPPDWRERTPLPLHLINALFEHRGEFVQAAALLSVNGDASLTLTAAPQPGQRLVWALRQPLSAEADMRAALAGGNGNRPDFALFFSCIGRGPYFYDGEDRDLMALTERYPGLPVIGGYGTGQIAFRDKSSRQMQNSVVTILHSRNPDVQSQP